MVSRVSSRQAGRVALKCAALLLLIDLTPAFARSKSISSKSYAPVSTPNTVLHTFAGEPSDGRNAAGGMTFDGTTLYGSTRDGGSHNAGIIFRLNPDGSGYSILHHFAGGASDGDGPEYSLVVSSSTIYGTTFNGGSGGNGTIFAMDTSGSNFRLLHSFPSETNDGKFPSELLLVGSTLYGMTEQGGAANLGTVFKIDTDGTGYARLHEFANGTGDGHLPFGGLTLAGSTLFGTTAQGGSHNNAGTIFKIDINGANYALVREFTGVSGDGFNCEHKLTLLGTTLYGVTNQGGTNGTGTIFKINTNGIGYGVIFSFEGTSGNNGHPSSALTLVNDHLIGATDPIDASFPDLIYSIALNGSGFGVLYRFNGPTSEGREPLGDLTVIGSTTYGVTSQGGTGSGVVYALGLPTLKIGSVNHSTGHFVLTGQSFPNSSVTIQTSPDLVTPFQFLGTTTADANGIFNYDDASVTGVSSRFYRAVSP
jgi:uncharacterized repeat protein (TIGR03803 family)